MIEKVVLTKYEKRRKAKEIYIKTHGTANIEKSLVVKIQDYIYYIHISKRMRSSMRHASIQTRPYSVSELGMDMDHGSQVKLSNKEQNSVGSRLQ